MASILLTKPSEADFSAPQPMQVERLEMDADLSGRFFTRKKPLAAQYADMYFLRLNILKADLVPKAKSLWPQVKFAERILDIETGAESVVAGTVYKEMKLKPNILDEFNNKDGAGGKIDGLSTKSFVSDDDYVVLEDESGRLTMALEPEAGVTAGQMLTGQIVAVRGLLQENGEFKVNAICYPGLPEQKAHNQEESYIVLVSGMALGDPSADPLAADMLVDYLTGNLGGEDDYKEASKVVRVVVAGGSCYSPGGPKPGSNPKKMEPSALNAKHRTMAAPTKELDVLLTRLCSSVPVDLMPGASDPANVFMPQQPFHRCLLPSANAYSSFRAVTNPYEACIGASTDTKAEDRGLLVVGTSGQNIEEVLRYSTRGDVTETLESMLHWRHLAPTAPDTLPCFPTKDEDPFILESCPHILFAGNQSEFGAKLVKGDNGQQCLVVSVPNFSATGTAVMINTKTLEALPMNFSTDAFMQG